MAVHTIVSEEELMEIITQNPERLVVLKLGASWCKPCQLLQPAFEELAEKLRGEGENAIFAQADADEVAEAFQRYEITKMPTVLALRAGCARAKLTQPDADALSGAIQAHLTRRPELVLDADF